MKSSTVSIFLSLLADYTMVTIIVPVIQELFVQDYGHPDDFKVGFVYSMKGIAQLCTGLIVGKISDKLQLKLMIQIGLTSDLIGSLVYSFGRKFPCYMIARTFHGIGSSLIASSGLSILANLYKTDEERGDVMSKAGSGISFGVLFGPVIGGLLYSIGEKLNMNSYARLIPFLTCTLVFIIAILCNHFYLDCPYTSPNKKLNKYEKEKEKENEKIKENDRFNKDENIYFSNFQLIKSIPILSLVYISFVGNLQTAYIEPILPSYWMSLSNNTWSTLKSGILFACSPLSYAILLPFIGKYGSRIGRHKILFIGMIGVSSIILIILPNKDLIYLSGIFLFIMGCGSSCIDGSLQPLFAQTYDILEAKEKKRRKEKALTDINVVFSNDEGTECESSKEIQNNENSKTVIEKNQTKKLQKKIIEENNDNILSKRRINEKINSDTSLSTVTDNDENDKDIVNEMVSSEEKIINSNNNESESKSDENGNKYTRVFSIGNMAMNIGFISGPMISSFFMGAFDGEDPSVNRFKSTFFKALLFFSIFGFLSSPVGLIPGMKRYKNA